MIDRLVQILAQGSELNAEEILDVLWLAATTSADRQADTETDSRAPAGTGPEGHVDELESVPESDSANEAGDAVPVREGDEVGQPSGTDAEVPLYLGGDAAGADDGASAPVPATEVAFGAPRPIRDPLTLPTALRSLRRIRTPGPVLSVDIDATVEATADAGGRLMTVLTRPPQRALDLALVADGAPSMDIWTGTFDELERLLAQTGAFRSVSRWTLRLSGDAVQLESRDGRAQPPRRLIDPTGRRLVLLATDGRDETWYSAAPWDTLDAWCAAMPTALLQVLPQHYWATTAVGDPYLTATALRPAAPNIQYVRRLAWWADDPGGVPLPVVTLSPQAMETWAQVVAGGTAWATGITAVPPARESAPSADDGADPLMLVNDFRSRASRGAQRLARILASTETLSIPLIEVLQDRLAPETGMLERAEVLASGMLTQNRTADGQALFRYRSGIAEILRRGATTFEEWDTYAAVSQYLEDRHHLGGPLRALVADPAGTAELDAAEAPFAALHESLAVGLGLRDPAVNRTASSATSGPSESEDPALGKAEHVLRDEAGNLLLDEAGDVMPSEAAADVHDEVDLREHAQDANFEATVGEDELVTASDAGIAAGVIHGNVTPPDPYWVGSDAPIPAPGEWDLVPGSVGADRSGTAIGRLEYQRRPEAPSLPVRLAPRPVFLAGREGLLAELDARLAAGSEQSGPRVAVLCGLGGAGKTSVAIEYAHRQLAEVGVCWQFPAEDPAVLAAEFAVLAAELGAREVVDSRDPVASVHALLARAGTAWLLVFDNAPDRAAVEAFVPPAGPGRVLITTQNQHWPPGQALDVPVLDPDVAADFLVNRTRDPDRAAARELAMELGGLPLALEQAAAYLQATGTTLARYLPLFRARQADLLARGEASGHPADVAATLGLAVSRLAEQAPAAAGLVRLLAFLAPEPVPLNLLLANEQAAGLLDREVMAEVGPLLGDPVAAGDAITALRRYSLVTPAGDGLVLVHRLVQAVTRAQLTADAASQYEQAAAALVEAAVPAHPALPAAWPACAVLLPHARAVLDLTSGGMQRIAQYLGYSGSYPAAQDLFRLVADAHGESDAYGPEHPATLTARHELARWTGEAGDAAGARDQFAALLPIRERVVGPEHPQTLATRHELARWTGEAGDAAGARDQFAALLPIRERVVGPEHPQTLATGHNLAYWTGEAGDAAGARDQFAALLPIRERVLGPEHPQTLATRHNLARWTGEAGDAAGARDQLAALLPIRERVLGPEHPQTLATRHNLARWTGEAGDAAGARDQLAALLPIRERVLGPEHPQTLATRHNLAYWTGEAGDAAGARDQLAALLPIRERVLGPEHPQTLATRDNLAYWTGQANAAGPDAS